MDSSFWLYLVATVLLVGVGVYLSESEKSFGEKIGVIFAALGAVGVVCVVGVAIWYFTVLVPTVAGVSGADIVVRTWSEQVAASPENRWLDLRAVEYKLSQGAKSAWDSSMREAKIEGRTSINTFSTIFPNGSKDLPMLRIHLETQLAYSSLNRSIAVVFDIEGDTMQAVACSWGLPESVPVSSGECAETIHKVFH